VADEEGVTLDVCWSVDVMATVVEHSTEAATSIDEFQLADVYTIQNLVYGIEIERITIGELNHIIRFRITYIVLSY